MFQAIDHIHVFVSDRAAAAAWYARVMDLHAVESLQQARKVDPIHPVPPEEIARVRDMVPVAHRDTFDDLLGEARHNSRLRDERGNYSDVWAAGICRRAILAAGARLASEGTPVTDAARGN